MKYRQISSLFFSPIYLNRCCGFLFYYTRTAERDQKKKNLIHFSSNQTKWEKKKNGVCKLGNTCFVALKRMGAENMWNHVRATSEPRGWTPVCSWFAKKTKKTPKDRPSCYSSTSLRKQPSIKISTQQHGASSNNSLFKNPKKSEGETKAGVWGGKQKKLGLEVHIYIFMYIYILIFILCPTSSPFSAYTILKSNFFFPTSRQATKTGR